MMACAAFSYQTQPYKFSNGRLKMMDLDFATKVFEPSLSVGEPYRCRKKYFNTYYAFETLRCVIPPLSESQHASWTVATG